MQLPIDGTLFVHYPCFDGLASAAIAADFLESQEGWRIGHVHFVNYDRLKDWLRTPLPENSAVLDFLFHPDAKFWADHHGTTFASADARSDYERPSGDRFRLYDPTSPSCALMLWRTLREWSLKTDHFDALAYWANRIDAAVYETIDEAIFAWNNPAAEINLTLSGAADEPYGQALLTAMRTMPLSEIATLPEVRPRVDTARKRAEAGLSVLRDDISLTSGDIAFGDITPPDGISINRYSPYYFFPDARYSVVLTRTKAVAKITAMRNPWRDFESVNLGKIFQHYGGGGHQRVGSLVLMAGDERDPAVIAAQIINEIHRRDRHATALEHSRV